MIFADGFESGSLSAWTSSVIDGGDLGGSAEAALAGRYGLKAVAADNHAKYVQDDTPAAEARDRAHFHIAPNIVLPNIIKPAFPAPFLSNR